MTMKTVRIGLIALLGMGFAACGGDDADDNGSTPSNMEPGTMEPGTSEPTACPEGTEDLNGLCGLSGRITTSLTLVAGNDYLLNGPVFIGDGEGETVLTIEAGITIYGLKDPGSPGTLIITRGSRIEANGTAEAPVVFTSDQLEGQKARGDWGGLDHQRKCTYQRM